MNSKSLTLPALTVLVAALAVAGCQRRDDTSAANPPPDSTVAQRADDMKADASKSMADAKESAKEASQDIKAAATDAADHASDKVADAVITTTVNAELAKDKSLSAMKIDVDTDAGRVALRGTAPDAAARDRATQLAMNVKGVVNVDNQLKVDNKM